MTMIMSSLLVLLSLLPSLVLVSATQEHAEITVKPLAQHQTEGKIATFTCTAIGTQDNEWLIHQNRMQWTVRETYDLIIAEFKNKGFSFHFSTLKNGQYTLTVHIVAWKSNNNTQLKCSGALTDGSGRTVYNANGSRLTIGSLPSPTDVRLTALNDTALVLSWEPPLVVWQNYSIEEYNITVQNLLGLQVFVVPAKNESQLVLTSKSLMSTEICQKLSIVITAVIAVDGRMLTSETQLSDFPQFYGPVQDVQVISSQASHTMLAPKISFQVPLICGYGNVTYTIIINESCFDEKISIGPKVYIYNKTAKSKVVENLNVNHDLPQSKYCEVVVMVSTGTTEFYSDPIDVLFSHTVKGNENNNNYFTVIIGASVGGATALIFILVAIVVFLSCYCFLQDRISQRSLDLSQPPLVANPIYEGPLYETIENQLSSLRDEDSSQVKPSEREQDTDELEEKISTGSDRYLKNPINFAKNASVLPPLSFLAFLDASSGTPSPAASSDSGQAMTVTAHLHDNADDTRDGSKVGGADSVAPQATLVGTDAGATSRPAQLGMQRSDLAEDNYTVMSPVVSGVPGASIRVFTEDTTFSFFP